MSTGEERGEGLEWEKGEGLEWEKRSTVSTMYTYTAQSAEANLARGQKGLQLADVGRVNLLGELDRELDDETAFVVGRSVGRHSLVHNLPDVAVLHHFA